MKTKKKKPAQPRKNEIEVDQIDDNSKRIIDIITAMSKHRLELANLDAELKDPNPFKRAEAAQRIKELSFEIDTLNTEYTQLGGSYKS